MGKINEVQLGLISTSTLDVVIETSLVSPVETKQVRKVDLYWTCFSVQGSVHTKTESYRFCSHENRTVRDRIVPISGSLFRTAQFLDLFWNEPLDFFRTRVSATPLSVPLSGTDRSGTVRYCTRVNRALISEQFHQKFLRAVQLALKR